MSNPLRELNQFGQVVWFDSIRRGHILSGELQKLIDEDGITGETSNPTIFDKAITGSHDYDEAIRQLAAEGKDTYAIYERIATDDVRTAADHFRAIYDRTNGADGFVSIEVSPKLAFDTQGTIAQARSLFQRVNRPNVMIKIPGTKEGVPAIEQCLYEGININITLLFAVAAYEAVAWAYVNALERRARENKPIDRLASVASFFVSRIDTLGDKLLEEQARVAGDPYKSEQIKALEGKLANANAQIAYEKFKEIFSSDRFRALANKGARVQRPLWASTSTKNPNYRDVLYVEPLIGPDTVNTLPQETIDAFREHGRVARTVDADVEGARQVIREVEAFGVSLDYVTQTVLDEGVKKFADSLDQLLTGIEEKRAAILESVFAKQSATLGSEFAPVAARLEKLMKTDFTARIWAHDATLWKSKPEHIAEIKQRLGWLTVAGDMLRQVSGLRAFADEMRAAGYTHALLLGMGGSSLCVEVLRDTFGVANGYLTMDVVDTTDPATIAKLTRKVKRHKTLFIVASKSGGTMETLAHLRYFYDLVQTGDDFIAITDADTSLEKLAREKKFRRVFLNPSDIGGRYAVLSYFGLVPAALMGVDIEKLLYRALEMQRACEASVVPQQNPGVWLGTILATLAQHGHDKITLVASPGIDTFGYWAEQLLAESTGKEGKGLIPIEGEPLGATKRYGADRLFVYLRLEGAKNDALDKKIAALEKAGQPVVRLRLDDKFDLGAEFFRWEFATAVAGALMQIDAFDQPNVQESKENTKRVLVERRSVGKALYQDNHVAVFSNEKVRGAKNLRGIFEAFLQNTRGGEYLALMAYLARTSANARELQKMRVVARDALGVATTVGFGPRFLHSTGQLHKGGPNSGVFIQITADAEQDAKIPGEKFSFGTLIRAQALGDYESLVAHQRRVLRVHLKNGASLGIVVKAFKDALKKRR